MYDKALDGMSPEPNDVFNIEKQFKDLKTDLKTQIQQIDRRYNNYNGRRGGYNNRNGYRGGYNNRNYNRTWNRNNNNNNNTRGNGRGRGNGRRGNGRNNIEFGACFNCGLHGHFNYSCQNTPRCGNGMKCRDKWNCYYTHTQAGKDAWKKSGTGPNMNSIEEKGENETPTEQFKGPITVSDGPADF